jgi:class 3 adenylate cyclase
MSAAVVETDQLQLVRWGLKFSSPQTESEYRAWHVVKAIPQTRVGMLASLLAWMVGLIALLLGSPSHFWSGARWILFLMDPVLIICIVVTYYPRLHRWVLPTTLVANAVSGLLVIGLCFQMLRAPLVAAGAVALACYFAFTIFRLHPAQAVCAAAAYVGVLLVLLTSALQSGQLNVFDFVWAVLIPLTALMTGAMACLAFTRISRESFRQERIIDAQRKTIEHERSRADDLLHNILPVSIANRLKAGRGIIANRFDEVTVVFADVVGFTPLAAKLSPEELVAILNVLFTRFDALAAQHGVEKIKTIGDAYMAVAGVPLAHANHAVAAAELALAMRAAVVELSGKTDHPIQLRIGLCTGPVVAGVIGSSKFAYDLWGDTVNTAARMESHSMEGQIQVTESTYRKLATRYAFQERGTIDIKGKGPMSTWLLTGHLPA